MKDFEATESFASFRELSGIAVDSDQVIAELRNLPLDGVLGFLAGLFLEIIQSEERFYDPGFQGRWLNLALVDDFPQRFPNLSHIYQPGHLPRTGRYVFVHEQNIAWLSHAALLHSKEGTNTPEITYAFRCRLFRILLIVNDLLQSNRVVTGPYDLDKRRLFALEWLRQHQFNRYYGDPHKLLVKLARQKVIMLDLLPNYLEGIEDMFKQATGVECGRYFEVLCLFVSHFLGQMRVGDHWFQKETLYSKVKAGLEDIETVLSSWARTPIDYRGASTLWRKQRRDMGELPVYDYVPLRETPFIEGRPGELVCPVPPFLFSKIEDGPFFILSDFLRGSELTRFHTALGQAYEEYANGVVERVSKSDKIGGWNTIPNPTTNRDGELADMYLQRGTTGIVFEHKGQRPGTEFLRGGEGERVLGPSAGTFRMAKKTGELHLLVVKN